MLTMPAMTAASTSGFMNCIEHYALAGGAVRPAFLTSGYELSATGWCTREGNSPTAVARVRIEIPSARAETRVSTRRSRRVAAIRSLLVTRPVLPAAFRKLDAVAVVTARLLPAPTCIMLWHEAKGMRRGGGPGACLPCAPPGINRPGRQQC